MNPQFNMVLTFVKCATNPPLLQASTLKNLTGFKNLSGLTRPKRPRLK